GRTAGGHVGHAARAVAAALLPRDLAGHLREPGAARAVLAFQRTWRLVPAPGRLRHDLVLRRRRLRTAARRCAAQPARLRHRVPRVRGDSLFAGIAEAARRSRDTVAPSAVEGALAARPGRRLG